MNLSKAKHLTEGVDTRLLDLIDLKVGSDMERVLSRIDAIESRIDAKIDGVERRIDTKIDGVEKRLEDKISNFKWTISIVIAAAGVIVSMTVILSRFI